MNCHEYSLRYWYKLLEGWFVISWNKENRYRKFLEMEINDIIAWYVRGNGYIAILQVKEKPKMNLTDDDLNFITNNDEWSKQVVEMYKYMNNSLPL